MVRVWIVLTWPCHKAYSVKGGPFFSSSKQKHTHLHPSLNSRQLYKDKLFVKRDWADAESACFSSFEKPAIKYFGFVQRAKDSLWNERVHYIWKGLAIVGEVKERVSHHLLEQLATTKVPRWLLLLLGFTLEIFYITTRAHCNSLSIHIYEVYCLCLNGDP